MPGWNRGYIACRILEAEGFVKANLSGGYRFYEAVMKDKCPSAETYICGADKNDLLFKYIYNKRR